MEMFGIDRAIGRAALIFSLVVFGWLIWIPVGAYVASQKHRSVGEGLLLGLLGPFGAIVEALLPTKKDSEKTAPR